MANLHYPLTVLIEGLLYWNDVRGCMMALDALDGNNALMLHILQ